MRLSTRLSLFFLAALAIVLSGFSATLCVLASTYLHRRADERLESAVAMLVSSAELDSDGIDWEPRGSALSIRGPWLDDSFFWTVCDDQGRQIDASDRIMTKVSLDSASQKLDGHRTIRDSEGRSWRLLGQRVIWRAGDTSYEIPDPRRPMVKKSRSLQIVAGLSLSGIRSTLRNLLLTTMGLSLGLWIFAFFVGERLARHALRPLSDMASAAQGIGAFDLAERLPTQLGRDELAKLGLEINSLLDRLHESYERQKRFTGDASHQLRTPLTTIQGHVDLSLRQDRTSDEYRQTLVLVQQKTRHLRQIVDALLFLSRSDTEAEAPTSVSIDLNEWLSDLISKRADGREADLSFVCAESDSIEIRVQPVLFGELVNNLLENASKYSLPGSPIEVKVEVRNGIVELSVTDHGQGITDEELADIFKPFYRGEDAKRRGTAGLGLGLSIASRLATSCGGGLSVMSRHGFGSVFTLRLPRATDAALARSIVCDAVVSSDSLSQSDPTVDKLNDEFR